MAYKRKPKQHSVSFHDGEHETFVYHGWSLDVARAHYVHLAGLTYAGELVLWTCGNVLLAKHAA